MVVAAQSATGIKTPNNLSKRTGAFIAFFCVCHKYKFMVGCAGPPFGGPVSLEAGSLNSVQSATLSN